MKINTDPRILLWDLECTSLNADFGYLLCFGYKWFGEKHTRVVSINDFAEPFAEDATDDSEVAKAALAILGTADMWVT